MSKESHSTAEGAVLASESVSRSFAPDKSRIHDFFFGVVAVLYEFFSFIISKIVHTSVIFGTVIHSRVLVPVSVFALAFAGVAYELWQRFTFASRSFAHKATVAMQQFRANRFALAATMLSVTFVIIASTLYGVGIKITVDGQELGYMYSRDEYTEALSFVEQRASEILERFGLRASIMPQESLVFPIRN